MAANAHARRIEHRATLRKAKAGELGEEETKAVQAAEATRVAAIKTPVTLNRKQRKNKKSQAKAKK